MHSFKLATWGNKKTQYKAGGAFSRDFARLDRGFEKTIKNSNLQCDFTNDLLLPRNLQEDTIFRYITPGIV